MSIQDKLVPETDVERLRQRAIIIARAGTDCWISHQTAAILRGWSLPRRLHDVHNVHLSAPMETGSRTRLSNTIAHRSVKAPRRLHDYCGAMISAPELTWLELAKFMRHEELVALGDQLVRRPYEHYEDRSDPWTTIASLRALVDKACGMHGVKRARAALPWVRVGADSPQETALRLAMIDAGLPEPELQVPAHADDPWSPCADLGYRDQRIAIQYDGDTHFVPEQARRDQARDNAFMAAGWILLRFNRDDARQGFVRAVAQIRSALSR